MPYKERQIEKKYYSIGEVSKILDVSASLLRFWESEFDILKPKKNSKGNRQYTKEDIEALKLIYHLVKVKGFTLQGAKDIIKTGGKGALENLEVIESLNRIKNFLIEIKKSLPD